MARQTRLLKRGGTYYFRARIPSDLLLAFGRAEFRYSLGTRDYREACRRLREASVAFDRECDRWRCERVSNTGAGNWSVPRMSGAALHAFAEDPGEDRFSPHFAEAPTPISDHHHLTPPHDLAAAVAPVLQQLTGLVENLVASHLTRGVSVPPSAPVAGAAPTPGWDVMSIHSEKQPGCGLAKPPTSKRAPASTMRHLLVEWKEAVPDRRPKTVSAFEATVAEFEKVVGKKPAEQLCREDIVCFCDAMGRSGNHYRTSEKKLTFIKALLNRAVRRGTLSSSPAEGVRLDKPKVSAPGRVSYEPEDLRRIFASPLYAERHRPRAGGGEAAAWIPALGAFTGARLEELAQLRVDDVKSKDGIDYLLITDIAEGAKVKTEASRRRLPVHPQLVSAGLLHYCERMKGEGAVWLFPVLTPDANGIRSAAWSKWWGRYARAKIGITERSKVFHSFRHAFADACDDAGISGKVTRALMGHAGVDVHDGYGRRAHQVPLNRLYDAISLIAYDGLVLPEIERYRSMS